MELQPLSCLVPVFNLDHKNIPINSYELLDKISLFFKLQLTDLSIQQASDMCFATIYDLAKQKQWNVLSSLNNEINQLVNSLGQSILIACIIQKDKILFQDLIDYEIAIHKAGEDGNLPLHYAAKYGHLKFARTLCNHNDIDSPNRLNQNPLHLAAFEGRLKIVKYLYSECSLLSNREAAWSFGSTHLKFTPFALSVIQGHVECIEFFLSKDPYCADTRIKRFGTVLHLAISFYQNQVLELFLNHYSDRFSSQLNIQSDEGETPLMLAAYLGNEEAIYLLSKKDVPLDMPNGIGNTALHYAVMGNQKNAVTLLIKLGASCQIPNTDKKTPSGLADTLIDRFGSSMKTIAASIHNALLKNLSGDCYTINYATDPIENLCLQGGGPKGVALVGVIEALETENYLKVLKRVAGTSAGGIVATLVALNCSSKKINEILDTIDLMDILDVDYPSISEEALQINLKNTLNTLNHLLQVSYNPVGTSIKVLKHCLDALWFTTGICKGEFLRLEVEKKIQEITGKPYFTFKDLRDEIKKKTQYKHLYLFATKIGRDPQILQMCSEETEDGIWDNIPLSDAVRGTMSIPGAFKPHRLHAIVNGKRVPLSDDFLVVDGGLLDNLPAEKFDRIKYTTRKFNKEDQDFPVFNKRTLAISFCEDAQKESHIDPEKMSCAELLKKMIHIYLNAESLIRNLNPYNKRRMIMVNSCGIGLLNFDLDIKQESMLKQSGKSAVIDFFKKQNDNFIKLSKKEEINTSIVPMHEIGISPGFYVYQGSNNWIKCEVPHGKIIHLNELLVERELFNYFQIHPLKIAFCECSSTIFIRMQDAAKETQTKITIQPHKAQIIEVLAECKYLKFEIR